MHYLFSNLSERILLIDKDFISHCIIEKYSHMLSLYAFYMRTVHVERLACVMHEI